MYRQRHSSPLEEPELSEEAREQIHHWMTNATEATEETLDQIDDMKILVEEVPDHGLAPVF